MHPYNWDPARLNEHLKPFIGGQLIIHTANGEIYRGKVISYEVILTKGGWFKRNFCRRKIKVVLEWLCKQQLVNDADQVPRIRWFREKLLGQEEYEMSIDYLFYYSQKNKHRVKAKKKVLPGGEFWRFDLPESPDNIYHLEDDEYATRKPDQKASQ